MRDLESEMDAHLAGPAVVDAAPDARINDLLYRRGESVEVPRLAREATGVHVEGDLVRAEELLRCGESGAADAASPPLRAASLA